MSSAASNPIDGGTSKPIMLKRNSDDIGWDYGVLVDPTNLNIIKCKLCGLQVTSGIYRMKLHIVGIRGQVKPCPKSSPEDKEKCKKAIDDSKESKKARHAEQQEVRDAVDLVGAPDADEDTTMTEVEELDGPGGKPIRKIGPMDKFAMPLDQASLSKSAMRQKLISETVWKERLHTLQRYIAKWVYVCGVPFNKINNVEFDQVIEAAGRFGPGGKKPNQHQLRESLLFEEVNETKKMLKAHEEEWAKNGCSVMTDAWTDQKRSIINLCVHCSIGSSFLESKEVSEESHTGQFIFEFVDQCIERIGAENVVQVVTDNASNNMATKDLLFVKRPKIFWSSCATHTLNLMLEGVGKMKRFKGCIDQAKSLTIFIYSHHKTLALMRKFTKKRDIVRPGVTRFA